MKSFLYTVLLLIATCMAEFNEHDYNTVFPNNEDDGTLKLITVLFRHGNRTPEEHELYPTDPHLNFTYFPYGLGQLTNEGKLKEFNLGISLRNRYNNFLGKYYYPEIVEATSTDYNRTKMSLELVLAGLFPPRREDMTAGLAWQPIPFNYLPRHEDKVLLGDLCPRYKEIYKEYSQLPKLKTQFAGYQDVADYISNNTGLKVTQFEQIYQLNFGLATEEEFGLPLPKWTDQVWPEPISTLAVEQYFVTMGHPETKKMLVGYLLEKILQDVEKKIQDNKKLSKKIILYSAHENNLAQLLIALGVFEKHIPTYGSHIVLELHKIDDQYGFKIFYERWDGRGLRLMKMSNCKEFCPLDLFKTIITEYLPTENNICGN